MYGSYSSYGSSCSAAQPLDITPSRTQSYSSAYCAFPSWPQRSSLAETAQHGGPRASSYLSDDDLYLYDLDEDAQSVSSGSSVASGSPSPSDQELVEMQRQQAAMQREAAMKFLIAEKERRRQAMKQKRRSSPGARKSPKSKAAMTPITE